MSLRSAYKLFDGNIPLKGVDIMSKKILSAIIALVVVFAMFIPTASAAVLEPVAPESDFDKVVDSWYVAKDGGFKFNVGTWSYYGNYGITLVEDPLAIPTSCLTVAVYTADADDVFAAKTQADFEVVLGETAEVFEARTVGNDGFPMYYCKTATYENYVFQANGQKYFINFINAGDKEALAAFAEQVMASIVIAGDSQPEPEIPETGDNTSIIVMGAVAALAFVAIIASKKRATSK